MKNSNTNIQNYLISGFYVSDEEIEIDKIKHLRSVILENLKNHNKNTIDFIDFSEELRLLIINLFTSNCIRNFITHLRLELNTDISILPIIQIMKNYHVNRLKTPGVGWHRDCAGEFQYEYCNNILSKKEYVFGKIGIYLQNNSLEIGGGIDLISKSHSYIREKNFIKRKVSAIRLIIVKILQKYFLNIYKLLPESFYIKFLKALKIFAKPGNPVFFDSRIVHRGSPINDSLIKNFKEFDNLHYELPDEKAKISIYCQFGSSVAVSSYFYDRLRRKKGEFENWFKEIELYKNYSKELHFSALKIMHDANLDRLK